MKKTGIILEAGEKHAVLLTSRAEFVTIKSKPGMFVGQQVDISAPPGNWFGIPKYRYGLGIIATLIIFIITFLVLFEFPGQSGIYAYVSLDINPSIEFAVNPRMRVINIKYFNDDGLRLLQETDLNDKPLYKAIMNIVAKAEQNNYFQNAGEKYMLISVATGPNRIKPEMKAWLAGLKQKLAKRNIRMHFIETTLKQRKIALKKGFSMGRYELYLRAHDAGHLITRNEAKTVNIYDLLNHAGMIHNGQKNAAPGLAGDQPENAGKNQNDNSKVKNDGANMGNRQNNDNSNIIPNRSKTVNRDEPENSVPGENIPENSMEEKSSNTDDITGSDNYNEENPAASQNDPKKNGGGNSSGGNSGGGSGPGSGQSGSGGGSGGRR